MDWALTALSPRVGNCCRKAERLAFALSFIEGWILNLHLLGNESGNNLKIVGRAISSDLLDDLSAVGIEVYCQRFQCFSLILLRLPFGQPAGLPLWPGLNRVSCFLSVGSGIVSLHF